MGQQGEARLDARRRLLVLVLVVAMLAGWSAAEPAGAAGAPTATAASEPESRPPWKQRLDEVIADHNVSVSVRLGGTALYRHAASHRRVPASNQKLLVTMALLDTLDPASRMRTRVAARTRIGAQVRGDLWLIGNGDPSITGGGRYASDLPFRASRLGLLARRLKAAGVTRISGSVVGARSYYAHDWWAPGWRWNYPSRYAPLASGLSFDGNTRDGAHVRNPELRAARALTRKLRGLGIAVSKPPRTGRAPRDLTTLSYIESVPLDRMLRYMNRSSSNYVAEMMGKRLAVAAGSRPGTIAAGADAVTDWALTHGVSVTAHDGSGLSYGNRLSARGLTVLLDGRSPAAARRVRATLPTGGQGTLEDRLHGVRVRAKTGTLPGYSALSGYVYVNRLGAWASFSILAAGMTKDRASALEDRVVRLLEASAR